MLKSAWAHEFFFLTGKEKRFLTHGSRAMPSTTLKVTKINKYSLDRTWDLFSRCSQNLAMMVPCKPVQRSSDASIQLHHIEIWFKCRMELNFFWTFSPAESLSPLYYSDRDSPICKTIYIYLAQKPRSNRRFFFSPQIDGFVFFSLYFFIALCVSHYGSFLFEKAQTFGKTTVLSYNCRPDSSL